MQPTKVITDKENKQKNDVVQDVVETKDRESTLQDTLRTCSCKICEYLRSKASIESMSLLDGVKELLTAVVESDSQGISQSTSIKKPMQKYRFPGKNMVALVKNHDIFINTDDRQSAYLAAGGCGASLVRELLLRLVPIETLKRMTARGRGENGIPPDLLDALAISANDLIRRSNEKTEEGKQQKPLGRREMTKILNTFLSGLRSGYHDQSIPKSKRVKFAAALCSHQESQPSQTH